MLTLIGFLLISSLDHPEGASNDTFLCANQLRQIVGKKFKFATETEFRSLAAMIDFDQFQRAADPARWAEEIRAQASRFDLRVGQLNRLSMRVEFIVESLRDDSPHQRLIRDALDGLKNHLHQRHQDAFTQWVAAGLEGNFARTEDVIEGLRLASLDPLYIPDVSRAYEILWVDGRDEIKEALKPTVEGLIRSFEIAKNSTKGDASYAIEEAIDRMRSLGSEKEFNMKAFTEAVYHGNTPAAVRILKLHPHPQSFQDSKGRGFREIVGVVSGNNTTLIRAVQQVIEVRAVQNPPQAGTP